MTQKPYAVNASRKTFIMKLVASQLMPPTQDKKYAPNL
jgi:hypothetical protein